jgi:hypothetical protein
VRRLRLFHGTTGEAARALLAHGWKPGAGHRGANYGQTRYLYVTTDRENARWFAEEAGGNTVLEVIGVPASSLLPDPEDAIGATAEEELAASRRNRLPASLVVTTPLRPDQFVARRGLAPNPPQSTTLQALYGAEYPDEDEQIWEFVGQLDYKARPYRIIEIDPVAWYERSRENGETMAQIFKDHAKTWQRRVVAAYRKDITKGVALAPVVVSGHVLADGQHRIIALALENVRRHPAVDLEQPEAAR